MNNIVQDVSVLSTIPEKTLNKLNQKIIYAICEAILEDVQLEKDISELDLGFGILYVKHVSDEIKYKFVPSTDLEKAVYNTVTKKLNLLEDTLNETLVKKFLDVYKDLC